MPFTPMDDDTEISLPAEQEMHASLRLQAGQHAGMSEYCTEKVLCRKLVPLGWFRFASITLDHAGSVSLRASLGDPRPASRFTVRWLNDGKQIMFVPRPDRPRHVARTRVRRGVSTTDESDTHTRTVPDLRTIGEVSTSVLSSQALVIASS